jgi:hypothetical protein
MQGRAGWIQLAKKRQKHIGGYFARVYDSVLSSI